MNLSTERKLTDDKLGFTIIEILISISIVGTLAAVILVVIDPVKRFHEARDANRQTDVQTILEAVLTLQADTSRIFAGDTTVGSAPLIANASEAQVIVNDVSGIDCGVPASVPLCPQLPPGYSLNADPGLACVTRLDQSIGPPSNATAAAVGGVGLNAGQYRYVVTFVTPTGESEPGPVTTVTTEEYAP
ncbi:MAG: prepilin-type N-terminal cleavage/methylation domain-containing protein [Patescibacteria group bacterium]